MPEHLSTQLQLDGGMELQVWLVGWEPHSVGLAVGRGVWTWLTDRKSVWSQQILDTCYYYMKG